MPRTVAAITTTVAEAETVYVDKLSTMFPGTPEMRRLRITVAAGSCIQLLRRSNISLLQLRTADIFE